MPYMVDNTLGDVASNRAAYAGIKGTGGSGLMHNNAEGHTRKAVSSGPMAAVIQQDTVTRDRSGVKMRMKVPDAPAVLDPTARYGYVPPGGGATFDAKYTDPFLVARSHEKAVLKNARISRMPLDSALVYRRSNAALLGEYGSLEQGPTYLGFSLGKVVKNIGNTVKKAVVDTGHTVGKVVTSKVGQGVLGTALAVTGVGAPAAAAIFAATKGAGNLIKPGGNLKGAATGAAQGAVEGVVAATAGKVARTAIGKIKSAHASTGAVATEAAKAALPVATGGSGAIDAILAAGIPGVAAAIPGSPARDGLIPKVSQPAPMFPKAKRVAASDSNRGGAQAGVAKKVVKAGQAVNKKANQGADQIDALSQKLDSLAAGIDAAKKLGDTAGIDALSQAAAAIQNQIAQAQNIAGGASGDLRAAGGAVEGAAVGAVGGGALSNLGDFVNAHKAAVYGTLGATALLITAAVMHKPQTGGTRTVYRRRPARARGR